MKVFLGSCLAMGFAAMMGACAVGGTASDDAAELTSSFEGSAATDQPRATTVPPQMSFDKLEDIEINGNEATINSCRVKLLFCRDSRNNNFPSFCSDGCATPNDFHIAENLCFQVCGISHCSAVRVGGC